MLPLHETRVIATDVSSALHVLGSVRWQLKGVFDSLEAVCHRGQSLLVQCLQQGVTVDSCVPEQLKQGTLRDKIHLLVGLKWREGDKMEVKRRKRRGLGPISNVVQIDCCCCIHTANT